MKRLTVVDIPKLIATLQTQNYDNLSPEDWEQIIFDLWKEDVEKKVFTCDPLVKNMLEERPVIGASNYFFVKNDDNLPAVNSAIFYFKDFLSLKNRLNLARGLTALARMFHIELEGKEGLTELLEMAVYFATHLGGGINPLVLEKIASDKKVRPVTRAQAAELLLKRDFDGPSSSFWKKLEEEVPHHHRFAYAVMTYHLRNGDPEGALNVLITFTPDPGEDIGIYVMATRRVFESKDLGTRWLTTFPPILKKMPEWAVTMIGKNVVESMKWNVHPEAIQRILPR